MSLMLTVAGCHGGNGGNGGDSDGGWHPSAQVAPSLRPTFGARVTDDELQILLGPGCDAVTKVTLSFDVGDPQLVLTSTDPEGAKLDRFTMGGPAPGFVVKSAPPENFDWRSATGIALDVLSTPLGFPGTANLADVVNGSSQHPADSYWVQGAGWLTESEWVAQDGKTLLGPCTPDPIKK